MPLLGSFGVSSFGLGKLAAPGLGVTSYDLLRWQTSTSTSLAAWIFGSFDTLYESGYEHFEFRLSLRRGVTNGAAAFNVFLNNDNSSGSYYRQVFSGNGSTFTGDQSNRADVAYYQGGGANYFSGAIIQILDPFNTNKRTTIRSWSGGYGDGTEQAVQVGTSIWPNTAKVNLVRISTGSVFYTGSEVRLYGLKAS